MNKTILGDSALNLQILKQHTTVVVEPTSQMGGTYDSTEITTVFTVNNDQEREVEFILPYSTVKFSASIAVISAGEQAYGERIAQVGRIRGDLSRIKSYLQKVGLPEDQYDTNKELKSIAKQFRAGKLKLPQGQVTIKIQLSTVIDEITGEDGTRRYSFKAYSPLPAFSMAGGRVPHGPIQGRRGYQATRYYLQHHQSPWRWHKSSDGDAKSTTRRRYYFLLEVAN